MRRRRVENVSAAEPLACERGSNKRHMAVENARPIRAVAAEAGESRRRAAGAEPKLEAAVRDEIEHRRVLSDRTGSSSGKVTMPVPRRICDVRAAT
jgi:hypothetical protein